MKVKCDFGSSLPAKYQLTLKVEEVSKVFPFGDVRFILEDGGMIAPSGRLLNISSMGDNMTICDWYALPIKSDSKE
jgi:hypothetical protein